ncbi:Ribosome assembly protein 3 [Yarrowia sp. B02]|nr:Ribosome assembly protein 3 [Yarrowia sp. B02]
MSAKSVERSNKATKTEEPKKRRRKKARTEISDSESDSESENEENDEAEEDEDDTKAEVEEDVEMMEFEKEDVAGATDIPAELRALPEDSANPEFQKFYMNLVTTEFGKDMDDLRTGDSFNGNTLGLLVDALKQGVNVFDEKTKAEVVKKEN